MLFATHGAGYEVAETSRKANKTWKVVYSSSTRIDKALAVLDESPCRIYRIPTPSKAVSCLTTTAQRRRRLQGAESAGDVLTPEAHTLQTAQTPREASRTFDHQLPSATTKKKRIPFSLRHDSKIPI